MYIYIYVCVCNYVVSFQVVDVQYVLICFDSGLFLFSMFLHVFFSHVFTIFYVLFQKSTIEKERHGTC